MKIGVIMGGISSEREVSLHTGREIIVNLNKDKYEAFPAVIGKSSEVIEKIRGADMAFIALHGRFGEDGTIQGILETLGIPYTGCNLLSSALCMDKDMSKRIMRYEGINTADWIVVQSLKDLDVRDLNRLGYPVVVKPNSGGSSVATFIASSRDEVLQAVNEALKYDSEVLVEQYIKGDEITCPVLNGKLLPTLAIKPASSFFDYTSKYTDGGADEYVVELEPGLKSIVGEYALKTYKCLKCSVYARIDMIIQEGIPYVLEVNTLPGMTGNSLFPKSAAAAGIPFGKLLDLIIEYSLSN